MPTIRDRIIRRVSHDRAAIRILVFLAEDLNGWFDTGAIETRAEAARPILHILDELVDDGFLVRQQDVGTVPYAPTRDGEVRDAVLHLVDREAHPIRDPGRVAVSARTRQANLRSSRGGG